MTADRPTTAPAPPPAVRATPLEAAKLAVAAGIGAFSLVSLAGAHPALPGWFLAVDAVLGAAAVAALRWRRARPVLVTASVLVVSAVASSALGAVLVCLVSVATSRRWRRIAALGGLLLASTAANALAFRPGDVAALRADVVLAGLAWAACTATGAYLGSRRDLVAALRARAEAAERATAAERQQARFAERTRIAREMHDVLAHRISLVAMHAGVLAFREDLPAPERAQAAGVVRDNANLALLELRQVLGVLRDPARADDPDRGDLPPLPQPTLADLDDLLAQHRSPGSPVDLEVAPGNRVLLAQVPPLTGRHAYRVVQEALTNARKHAPGAPVVVRVEAAPGLLVVEVRNGPATADRPSGTPGSGTGLVGVEERVRQLDGTLVHGPDGAGGYRLRAELPWDGEAG